MRACDVCWLWGKVRVRVAALQIVLVVNQDAAFVLVQQAVPVVAQIELAIVTARESFVHRNELTVPERVRPTFTKEARTALSLFCFLYDACGLLAAMQTRAPNELRSQRVAPEAVRVAKSGGGVVGGSLGKRSKNDPAPALRSKMAYFRCAR